MRDTILKKLDEIEEANNVKILFAIESGSRAWGFASPDSDYDVRFVYVHPQRFYLSIHDHRDVIELPVNEILDIGGWDIRKALRFIGKTNAVIYEWYQSPIIYRQHTSFLQALAEIGDDYFSPRAAMHHYLSMTINTFETSLKTEKVKLKKYFYAFRPVLAARWIAQYGTVPPMEFGKLRAVLTDSIVNREIDSLLSLKATADEKYEFAPNAILNEFLAEQIDQLKIAGNAFDKNERDTTHLDELFMKTILEAHGHS